MNNLARVSYFEIFLAQRLNRRGQTHLRSQSAGDLCAAIHQNKINSWDLQLGLEIRYAERQDSSPTSAIDFTKSPTTAMSADQSPSLPITHGKQAISRAIMGSSSAVTPGPGA